MTQKPYRSSDANTVYALEYMDGLYEFGRSAAAAGAALSAAGAAVFAATGSHAAALFALGASAAAAGGAGSAFIATHDSAVTMGTVDKGRYRRYASLPATPSRALRALGVAFSLAIGLIQTGDRPPPGRYDTPQSSAPETPPSHFIL